jgi:hypothetical protein
MTVTCVFCAEALGEQPSHTSTAIATMAGVSIGFMIFAPILSHQKTYRL